MAELPETNHFNLTRVGEGEPMSKNGYAFLNGDVLKIDDILWALMTHTHDGEPALGDPSDACTLVASQTGGQLPAATTFYYRVSFVDRHGLETAASPEVSVTTPDPIPTPPSPAASVESINGTVVAGTYSYLVTQVDAYGGETTPSGLNAVQVTTGSTNRIRLDLSDLAAGAVSWNIYRSRPGQSQFYYVGSTPAGPWYDTGLQEDQTVTSPTINTTNSKNSVQVTIPGEFVPLGCVSWRIYRAATSGGYDGNSLVKDVVEGATDTSVVPVTVWTDAGDVLQPGLPQNSSSTLPSPSKLNVADMDGTFTLSALPRGGRCVSAFGPGVATDGRVLNITNSPTPVLPTRLTAYFQTPPTGSQVVRIQVTDSADNDVELSCPATPQAGDPAGYYHLQIPLVAAQTYEAETGTRSDSTAVPIVTDLAAVSGSAVNIDAVGEYVQAALGQLETGTYHTSVRARVIAYDTSATGDLVIEVVRVDTSSVVATITYNMGSDNGHTSDDTYQDYTGPSFMADGALSYALRARKATESAQAFNVDNLSYTVDVPTLVAGPMTITQYVDNGPTGASDVNVQVWF